MISKEKVDFNLVVGIEFMLTIEGDFIDMPIDLNTLEYLHGHNNIIPGLERELRGMVVGESKIVVVSPKDGYGDYDSEALVNIPIAEFSNTENLSIGSDLEMENIDGVVMIATVIALDNSIVKLDFNHPLAGKELQFDVKIITVRSATEKELENGEILNSND
ncbi:MAG: FKBP-type peptidyl-prolyl cis-trans isomerase [Chloroflexota bacterium]